MIRFSKILFMNPARIWISGVKCNYDNIIKITNLFNWERIGLTIDSVTEESRLLEFIKNLNLKYSLKEHSNNYMEIFVVVPCDLLNCVLEKAIIEEPENIFVLNLFDNINQCVYFQDSFEKLVANGVSDKFIVISFDENVLLISVNKSLIEPQKLYRKIKRLRFD